MGEIDLAAGLLIGMGVLVILTRSPLLFAPRRTIHAYMAMVSTDRRIRTMGVIMGVAALSLLMSGFGDSGTARWPTWILWTVLSVGLSMTVFSAFWRTYVQDGFGGFAEKLSDGMLRGAGALAVSIGAFLVYLGLYVM